MNKSFLYIHVWLTGCCNVICSFLFLWREQDLNSHTFLCRQFSLFILKQFFCSFYCRVVPLKAYQQSPTHLSFFNTDIQSWAPGFSLCQQTPAQKHEFHLQCHYINSLLCVSQLLISLSPSQHPPLLSREWHNGTVYLFNQKTPAGAVCAKCQRTEATPDSWSIQWLTISSPS